MISTVEQQYELIQTFIKTIEYTCTNPKVLEDAYARLAELEKQLLPEDAK
jgi:hypothetical protein